MPPDTAACPVPFGLMRQGPRMQPLTHDEAETLAAGYVLSALDPEEERAFIAHLATCAECQREVTALEEVMGPLALAAPDLQPPPGLWESIRDRAGLTNEGAAVPDPTALPHLNEGRGLRTEGTGPDLNATSAPLPRTSGPTREALSRQESPRRLRHASNPRQSPPGRRQFGRQLRRALVAVNVAILLGLVAWNVALSHRAASQATALAALSPLRQAANGHGQMVVLSAIGTGAGARATVAVSATTHRAVLLVNGLPTPARGQVDQLWTIPPGKPASAAIPGPIFRPHNGARLVPFATSSTAGTTYAVTVEPGPNPSAHPTSGPILAGQAT